MASEDTSCSDVLWSLEWEDITGPFLSVLSPQGRVASWALPSEPVVPPGGVLLANPATGIRFRKGLPKCLDVSGGYFLVSTTWSELCAGGKEMKQLG